MANEMQPSETEDTKVPRDQRLPPLTSWADLAHEPDWWEELDLANGFWVACVVQVTTYFHRTYVGEIKALTARGLRLTQVDMNTGIADGWDIYIPLDRLLTVLVATPAHTTDWFLDAAREWANTHGSTFVVYESGVEDEESAG